MSLRDQLVAAGLVSKKKARKAAQEKRKADKRAGGNRERKKALHAEEARRKADQEARRKAEREAVRRAEAEVRNRYERALRIRQIIRAHEVRAGGPVIFHHRDLGGGRLLRMAVSRGIAAALQRGTLGIAAENMGTWVRYAVVGQVGADKLEAIAPEVLVHREPREVGEDRVMPAAEPRDWEPDLRARRATAADVERLRAASRTSTER